MSDETVATGTDTSGASIRSTKADKGASGGLSRKVRVVYRGPSGAIESTAGLMYEHGEPVEISREELEQMRRSLPDHIWDEL